MAPFFDSSKCPSCSAGLPASPVRCLVCGVELTGPTVSELVTTLRRADSLVDRMRVEVAAASVPAPVRPSGLTEVPAARSWFAGRSVGVILLVLGAFCVLAAAAVFVAVAWMQLPIVIRALILVLITAGFALLAQLALRRALQSTAEAMAVIASGMFVLDLAAARRAGLPGLADLAAAPYEILAGALLAAAAGAAALTVRRRHRWLWSLDVVVALALARATLGALRYSGDAQAVSTLIVTVVASLLYVACRRLRLPVARWTALGLGGLGWLVAVGMGAEGAADHLGGDVGQVVASWPALTASLVAGLWSTGLTRDVWRRVASALCLLPVLLVFEIVGWSHGWVSGALVMLVGYVVAVVVSAHVSTIWSPAVSGSAAVLGMSAVFGLVPSMLALVTRMGLAVFGSWRGPEELPLDLVSGDVAPWLLPVTTFVVLSLLPRMTIGSHRISLEQRYTAGLFVATLALMPMLYGAGFWVSMSVLVIVAVALACVARLWRNDVLLAAALLLLAVMRICAFYDDLADPLAWTVMSAVCLAWALTERRPLVRAGFLTVAGLFALASATTWLNLSTVPRAFQGLVIVVVGSLGLLASQSLRTGAYTRAVGEGLSVTWVLAGLAIADSSPSHRAVELTAAGVAAGITAYLSEDRRRAGWVSGVLLTVASWIRLVDTDVETVEWYTVPAAAALLVYGIRRFRSHPGESTRRCLGPGLVLALIPSLLLAVDEPVTIRGLFVGLVSVALVVMGVSLRLAAPFALGVLATGLLALRNIWPAAAFIPRWTLLFLIGGLLLGMGMTWESRVRDLRTARRYVRGLR